MTKTIVAIYDDIVVARQVVEDLVNAGFARNSISLITNDAQNQYSHYLDKDHAPREDAVTAAQGAGFGAVVGALTGILVGVVTVMIPGIGLAIAAGPIVAGAVTGGVVGVLVKSGVPEDEAPYYAEGIRRGGTLISIQTSDTLTVKDIMNRHGSINIHERVNLWRQNGWKGFDSESVMNEDAAKSPLEKTTSPTTETPITREVNPITVVPVVVAVLTTEPKIEDDDTTQVLPLAETAADSITDTTIPVKPIPNMNLETAEPILPAIEEEPQTE